MTPRRSAVLMGIVALFGASYGPALAADWTSCRFNAGLTGYTEERLDLPLSLAWQYNANRSKNNPSNPAVVNGTVYFCSGDRLYAVDAESGVMKWRYPAEEGLAGMVKTSVTVAQGMVLFGATDKNLYAINAETGKYEWAFTTSGAIKSSPVVSEGNVYFGSDDDNLYAVKLDTGESLWKSGFRTKDDVSSSPCVAQGIVVFASKDTYVYAANAATGRLRWWFRLPNALSSGSPVISEGNVFIASGNQIDILNLGGGSLRGTIELPSDAVASPVVVGKELYVACRDKKLYAFDFSGKTPKVKWAQPAELKATCAAAPTVAGDTIYVPCTQGGISAFSTADGILRWRYVVTPSKVGQSADFTDANTSPVVANGALYVLTDDGALHCFRNGAPDGTSPDLFNVQPTVGSAMNGSPPIDITATIVDPGSGIDESSIQLSLDDVPVEYEFDLSKSQVKYSTPVTQPVKALKDGPHSIRLVAKDWKGNKLDAKWSFLVDNTMRPKVIPKKPSGEKAKTDPNKRDLKRPSMPTYGPNSGPGTGTPTGPGGPPMPPPPPGAGDYGERHGGRHRDFQGPPGAPY